jgi:2-keto-4-pentenoate hydratase/2-oxohepta-3-ene-1,7-dioic acid hydratase in catechol pathway
MKLATFTHSGHTRIGVALGDQMVDLSVAAPGLPGKMRAFLAAGNDALDVARTAADSGDGRIAMAEVTLRAPVLRPPKILAAGLNYKDHIAETGMETPKIPIIFNKQSTSVIGPGEPVHRPLESEMLDYEGEFGVIIGRRCRRVPKERAAEVIAGYTIVNDVSVRDWQLRVPTMTMGKSWDTHCPMGPYLVTPDELGDPHTLVLKTEVNGEVRQSSNTSKLLFNAFDLIEHMSTAFTLEPGDLIATGTPGGVAVAMQPPQWLKNGDTVRVTIDGLGTLENSIIDDPTETFIG